MGVRGFRNLLFTFPKKMLFLQQIRPSLRQPGMIQSLYWYPSLPSSSSPLMINWSIRVILCTLSPSCTVQMVSPVIIFDDCKNPQCWMSYLWQGSLLRNFSQRQSSPTHCQWRSASWWSDVIRYDNAWWVMDCQWTFTWCCCSAVRAGSRWWLKPNSTSFHLTWVYLISGFLIGSMFLLSWSWRQCRCICWG